MYIFQKDSVKNIINREIRILRYNLNARRNFLNLNEDI